MHNLLTIYIQKLYIAKCCGRLGYLLEINILISWFGIGYFIGGDIAGNIIFIFFPGMRFSGVTQALVQPDRIETPVRILSSNTITSGAYGSDLLIKFGALVTFCVLIDYLGIFFYP